MRKIRLFSIAALALAMAACSSEENTLETQSPAANGKLHFTATIATPDNGAVTRTEYSEQADGTINVAWKENDKIAAIVINSENKHVKTELTVSEVNADGSAVISGDIAKPKDGEETVDLIYPASIVTVAADGSDYTISFEKMSNGTLDGTLESIANNIDYRRADDCPLTVSGDKATLTSAAKLESKLSILKLTLQDKDGNPLSASKVAIANGAGVMASATLATAASEVYLPVLVDATSADIVISATKGDDTYYYLKKNVTLAACKYYQSTVKMTKPVDLSMVDNAGNARDKQWTANCYMVHKAGDYKLPLVYGNAIKNGVANSAAWTGVSGQLATFTNHANKPITDPWIKNNKDESGNDIVVSTAELLWQDAQGLITAVGIIGDYLTLTVGKDATTQQGNALVAAKDAGGKIVWSWHIWVTKETFADATLTTIATGSRDYKVTPVNLGWVPTGGDGKQGYNTYYQWGRKDPFKAQGAPAEQSVYDIDDTAITGMTYTNYNSITIGDNIQNPTTFYYKQQTNSPCGTQYYNMWDAQQGEQTQAVLKNITTATVKTVYDPCPAGFCVPTSNLFDFMGKGVIVDQVNNLSEKREDPDWDDTNKGKTWKQATYSTNTTGPDLYFPAVGYRNYTDGTIAEDGTGGPIWSASPDSKRCGRGLQVYLDQWFTVWMGRIFGNSVRAVAEE